MCRSTFHVCRTAHAAAPRPPDAFCVVPGCGSKRHYMQIVRMLGLFRGIRLLEQPVATACHATLEQPARTQGQQKRRSKQQAVTCSYLHSSCPPLFPKCSNREPHHSATKHWSNPMSVHSSDQLHVYSVRQLGESALHCHHSIELNCCARCTLHKQCSLDHPAHEQEPSGYRCVGRSHAR